MIGAPIASAANVLDGAAEMTLNAGSFKPGAYKLVCKYQSDLSQTPRLFRLMLLDAVDVAVGQTVLSQTFSSDTFFLDERYA
jgi:hypothetical protein